MPANPPIVQKSVYDAKNRLARIEDSWMGTFTFGYDGMDRRTELKYPNGLTTSYAYDNAYRLTSMITKNTTGAVLDGWSYAYDAVGQGNGVKSSLGCST